MIIDKKVIDCHYKLYLIWFHLIKLKFKHKCKVMSNLVFDNIINNINNIIDNIILNIYDIIYNDILFYT